MDTHLNFFVPYESIAASHENQLTRALLVVLRYSPMVHQGWLHLIAPEHRLQDLPKAVFATQRQRVLGTEADVSDGEAIPGISVWLAPDAKQVSAAMAPSDRQQVLDAIVTYGNDLVVVVENKIGWSGVTEQPHRINLHGAPVKFEGRVRSVPWQAVLTMLSDLVERELVSGAERLLVGDFLDLVEGYFPRIGPYSTLARCGQQRFRVERRLDALLGKVVGVDDGKALGWRFLTGTQKIAMAWLGFADDNATVSLRLYPADTLGQARAFYSEAASVQAVLDLRSEGWQVKPNFHWGFMAAGYSWVTTPLGVEEYCSYWVDRIDETRELGRADWEAYWAKLVTDRIVEPAGKAVFDQEFTASQRQKTHPRPGLFCEYTWPLADAMKFDARDQFGGRVKERLNQMLTALNAPLVA